MFKIYNHAKELPPEWNKVVRGNWFLNQATLMDLERLNPCSQSYHFNQSKEIALVIYKLELDLFTFTKGISWKFPVNIIGLPLSVAKPGYHLVNRNDVPYLCQYIRSLKGFYLALNSTHQLELAQGNTLPTHKIEIKWQSLEEYLQSLRSHYRYRHKKALTKFAQIEIKELADNNLFDQGMYRLYSEVYEKSEAKLEKVSIEFFKEYPAKILTFSLHGETIAFVQLVENEHELIFLLGGFSRQYNQKLDLYLNILLKILDYAIQKDYKQLDLGQTAEETKVKLGALSLPMYMYCHHSSPLINGIITKLISNFSYKKYHISHRVFKEDHR